MKKFSKILCLVLSFILAFSMIIPAFAADNSGEECPIIHIPGIATSIIYADKDDPSTRLPAPDADSITAFVKEEFIPALLLFCADRDTEKLARCVTEAVNTKYEGWFNNPDGTAKGNSGARLVYPDASSVKAGAVIRFDYDWRSNPLDIADELNAYIEYVKSVSGFDKVAIASHSLGNVIALSYLSEYGYDDIQGIVFDSPAIDGVTYIGELFCGDMEITGDSLVFLLKQLLGENEYKALLGSVIDAFRLAGIPEMLSVFLNDIIDELMPTVFEETLVPLCSRWLTIWSMVPDSFIDDAMDSVFNGYCEGEDLSALRNKIVDFNNNVRADKHGTLLAFDEVARVAVISRYGQASLPITASWDILCDGVVDTQSSSFGATTAPIGKVFDDDYLEGKDLKYISPDKTVDASTCLFPEKTWFIKDLAHESISATRGYYSSLLFSEEEATTETYTLSRFSIYNAETEEITVDESEPDPAPELTPWQILINFIRSIIEKLLEFFKR